MEVERNNSVSKHVVYHKGFFTDKANGLTATLINTWGARDLLFLLMKRDFLLRTRQSFLGYFWLFFPQVIILLPLFFLVERNVLSFDGGGFPFFLYALWGMSCWQLFSSILVGSMSSLVNAGSLIGKVNFPKQCLVISSVGAPVFDFLVRMVPVSLLYFYYDIPFSLTVLLLPFVVLSIVMLALSFGLYLSVIRLLFVDVSNAVNMLLALGVFLCPVFYQPFVDGVEKYINFILPVNGLIILSHDLFLGRSFTMLSASSFAIALSVINLFIGIRFFDVAMPTVASRV